MPKRLATGPMIAALIFALISAGLIAVPYVEPTFDLGGNLTLVVVISSVATVLMILLAVIVGSRDDDDDESLTEEDMVPSVAFGPGSIEDDNGDEPALTKKEQRARKKAEKEAQKEAQQRAKFEEKAAKEAEKAAKKAAKKSGKKGKKGSDGDADDSDWVSGLRDDDADGAFDAAATATAATAQPSGDEEVLETTSFQVPPPASENVDYTHAATASPMFEEDDTPDDEYLTAAYLESDFEIPFQEYANAETGMETELETEMDDEMGTDPVDSTFESMAEETALLTEDNHESEHTLESDELDAEIVDADEQSDELADEQSDELAGDSDALTDDDTTYTEETSEMELETEIMDPYSPDPELTDETPHTSAPSEIGQVSSRLHELTQEMNTLLRDVTLESEELRGQLTALAEANEEQNAELLANLRDAREEVDRLNEEYASATSDKRDALELRSMLVDAENKAMRASIDREQILARLRQVRFSTIDGAEREDILALLDKTFAEIDEDADTETPTTD